MTQAQRDILAQVKELMNEHFDSWILQFQTENDDKTDTVDTMWHGGYATAIGLCRIAEREIVRRQETKYGNPDDE
jgi:hypothetical protein